MAGNSRCISAFCFSSTTMRTILCFLTQKESIWTRPARLNFSVPPLTMNHVSLIDLSGLHPLYSWRRLYIAVSAFIRCWRKPNRSKKCLSKACKIVVTTTKLLYWIICQVHLDHCSIVQLLANDQRGAFSTFNRFRNKFCTEISMWKSDRVPKGYSSQVTPWTNFTLTYLHSLQQKIEPVAYTNLQTFFLFPKATIFFPPVLDNNNQHFSPSGLWRKICGTSCSLWGFCWVVFFSRSARQSPCTFSFLISTQLFTIALS